MSTPQNDQFWKYFREAAADSPFSMPDLSKAGDWLMTGSAALTAFIGAAETSARTGTLSMGRIIAHLAATGRYRELALLSRYLGWVVKLEGRVVSMGAVQTAASGTQMLEGRIAVSLPGVAATVAGSVMAAYVGTLIGCLAYAKLRTWGFFDPKAIASGWTARQFEQIYGYDPQTDKQTDELLRRIKTKNAAMRAAYRMRASIPGGVLAKFK